MYVDKASSKGVSPDLPMCSLLQCDGGHCQQQRAVRQHLQHCSGAPPGRLHMWQSLAC